MENESRHAAIFRPSSMKENQRGVTNLKSMGNRFFIHKKREKKGIMRKERKGEDPQRRNERPMPAPLTAQEMGHGIHLWER